MPARRPAPRGVPHRADATLSFYSRSGPTRRALNSKTRLCEHFERNGRCPHGLRCTFAHGPAELSERVTQVEPAIVAFLRDRHQSVEDAGSDRLTQWRKELTDLKQNGGGFAFPANLNAAERKAVHLLCDELGLDHRSKGEGAQRRLHVKAPMPKTQVLKTVPAQCMQQHRRAPLAGFGKQGRFGVLEDSGSRSDASDGSDGP